MISIFTNEFWTSKQRAASSLHEISYRACLKPQLPRFFIERLTEVGDLVYDPFMGRGTTLLESILLGRRAVGCDINPLSAVLLIPRLNPPTLEQVRRRLCEINWKYDGPLPEELLAFNHPRTLEQICALRETLRSSTSPSMGGCAWWRRIVSQDIQRIFLSLYATAESSSFR